MVQRFSSNRGLIENDRIVDPVKRFYLTNTRQCFDEILSSNGFTQAIKDEEVFLVLRRIENRTIDTDLDTLIETLRTFGTAPSYDTLAELCFRNYISTNITSESLNKINIEVQLSADQKPLISQAGDQLVTQPMIQLFGDITIGQLQSDLTVVGYSSPSLNNYGSLTNKALGFEEVEEIRTGSGGNDAIVVQFVNSAAPYESVTLRIGAQAIVLPKTPTPSRYVVYNASFARLMRDNAGNTLPIEITAQRTLPANLETKLTIGERPSDPRQVGHDKDLEYGSLEKTNLGGREVMRVRTSDNDSSFVVRLENGELAFNELYYTVGEFTEKLTPSGDQYVTTTAAPMVAFMRANVGNTLDIKISEELTEGAPTIEGGEGSFPAINVEISAPTEPTIQKELIAISRGDSQARNDYEYLVNYLAPNPREIVITYTEG
ncbi:hypothetical protein NVP1190O_22 [Vibrio phage 1.190.O._10N.286.51.F12]|nr:hypothetical protein NVP1190O_22 [Vibrio phage 1.190.O._10N.286.51.F12]